MKKSDLHYQIFRKGSTTCFNTARFLPSNIKQDVFTLCSFFRIADNLVDNVPPHETEFYDFKEQYLMAREGTLAADPVIDPFVALCRKKNLAPAWVDAFLDSKAADLTQKTYTTLSGILTYIYGSAEVIALCMARLFDLPETAYPYAQMAGRAIQYIDFICDIKEDLELERSYLPLADSGLDSLQESEARLKPHAFKAFVAENIELYRKWQAEAAKGFALLPRRYLLPVKTAFDMYNRTALTISADPFIVYEKKVKPLRSRILMRLLKNIFSGCQA